MESDRIDLRFNVDLGLQFASWANVSKMVQEWIDLSEEVERVNRLERWFNPDWAPPDSAPANYLSIGTI